MKKYYIVLLVMVLSGSASAQVYKWVDDSGRVHYGEKAKEGTNAKKLDATISITDNKNNRTNSINTKQVVMYSTSWCGYCRKARKYFKSKNIPFVEYDIERNVAAKREYDALKGRGVPVIVAGKRVMNGFSVAAFERMYQK